MPLLFFILLGVTTISKPVQAQWEVREYKQPTITRKYIKSLPCYTFIRQDFSTGTYCPRRYILVFSDGYTMRVSQEQYDRQVIGRVYQK